LGTAGLGLFSTGKNTFDVARQVTNGGVELGNGDS